MIFFLFSECISLEKNIGRILSLNRNNFCFVSEYIPLIKTKKNKQIYKHINIQMNEQIKTNKERRGPLKC